MSGPTEHLHSHPGTSSITALGHAHRREPLSVWFFCGILCLAYGLVLVPIGIYQFAHPPAVVLPELHVTFWWGLVILIFGAFYTIRYRPGRV